MSPGTKIADFDPNWAFSDWNSSLNWPMATKWCTKLEVAYRRCHIAFQGHLSNCKVKWDKKSANFYPNWSFSECNSSLNSLMALRWWTKLDVAKRRRHIVILNSYISFQGHTGWKLKKNECNLSEITRPVAGIKSLRSALFCLFWWCDCSLNCILSGVNLCFFYLHIIWTWFFPAEKCSINAICYIFF